MSAPNFEINARIRAKRLVTHVPPDAQTRTEGEEVTLVRHEQRSGVPETMEAGGRYSDVIIDKRIVATQDGHTIGGAAGHDRAHAARPPRSPKRSATVTSSSAEEDDLAEAVRNINEGAAILREVRHDHRRD